MGSKYRWDEKNYDRLFRLCVSLTNFHIRWHPLRDVDGASFRKYKSRLYSVGAETASKRKRAQSEYRARRRARLARNFSSRQNEEGAGAMLDLLNE